MSTDREGKRQKWQRKAVYDKKRQEHVIYPHFHCAVCDGLIGNDEIFEQDKVKKGDKHPSTNNFCSKACYEIVHKPKDKGGKPHVSMKEKVKKHFLGIMLGAYGGIMALVILVLWLINAG